MACVLVFIMWWFLSLNNLRGIGRRACSDVQKGTNVEGKLQFPWATRNVGLIWNCTRSFLAWSWLELFGPAEVASTGVSVPYLWSSTSEWVPLVGSALSRRIWSFESVQLVFWRNLWACPTKIDGLEIWYSCCRM